VCVASPPRRTHRLQKTCHGYRHRSHYQSKDHVDDVVIAPAAGTNADCGNNRTDDDAGRLEAEPAPAAAAAGNRRVAARKRMNSMAPRLEHVYVRRLSADA
jgi:hypothetical protein